MGMQEKIEHAADELTGKAKKTMGEVSDNEELEAEGKPDEAVANLKQAGEDVKDAFK